MAINTIDAIHHTAAEASKQKQDGNGLAYLLKNNETARAIGAAIDGQVGIVQSISRGIASIFETAARPQNLGKAKNMAKNVIRETLPHQDTHGNRKAPQLQRYASKHQHDPHRIDVEKEDTQSSYSDGINKSDKRTTKARKLLTHSSFTKPLKIMGNALATPFHALADIGQRRQKQEMRHMVRGKFAKADRTHTRRTWKRLTSRDYRDTGSSSPTSSTRTSRRPQKRKKKSSDTQSNPQPQSSHSDRDDVFATNQPSSKTKVTTPPPTPETKKTETRNTEKKKMKSKTQQEPKANNENKEKAKDITQEPKQKKNPKPETQTLDPEIVKNLDLAARAKSIDRKKITRKNLQDNPDIGFIFGDNFARKGNGGQAKEMRGEKNALGIATLHEPEKYFSDDDFPTIQKELDKDIKKVHERIDSGKPVIIPKDGIGTGIADLTNKAPKIKKYLDQELEKILDKAKRKFPEIYKNRSIN